MINKRCLCETHGESRGTQQVQIAVAGIDGGFLRHHVVFAEGTEHERSVEKCVCVCVRMSGISWAL